MQVDRLIAHSLINIASGLISAMSHAVLPLVLLRMVGHDIVSAWTLRLQFATYIWFLNFAVLRCCASLPPIYRAGVHSAQETAVLASGKALLKRR